MLVREVHRRELRRLTPIYFRGRLIDIGCGLKPHAKILKPFVTEHIGVDLPAGIHGSGFVDIEATAYDIPIPDSTFDSALCTVVLEHLEEPLLALKECHRILRPGAYAIYSAPFIWHLHEEPRDFFRYSKHGLRYLAEKAGFEVIEIRPLGGFWITSGQMFVYYIYRAHRGIFRRVPIIPAVGLAIQIAAYLLDRIDRAEEWTWLYTAVLRKPDTDVET